MIWKDRDEIFSDPAQIQGFLDFWDAQQPWRRLP
jgi:hypothetical protein